MSDKGHALLPDADFDRRAAEEHCKGMALLQMLSVMLWQ
jgi:hypothetical protein